MPVVYTGMYKGERFNSISHLVGAALALAGGVVLVTYAAMDGDTRKIRSYSLYGFTLFLLYFGETGLACMTSLILRVH
jgi:hemolysin III